MAKSEKLSNFHDYAKHRLGETAYQTLKTEAQVEAEIYRALQQQFATAIQAYMEREQKGFNDLVRELGLSQSQVTKMLKGSGNFTFSTLAHVGAVIKQPLSLQFSQPAS